MRTRRGHLSAARLTKTRLQLNKVGSLTSSPYSKFTSYLLPLNVTDYHALFSIDSRQSIRLKTKNIFRFLSILTFHHLYNRPAMQEPIKDIFTFRYRE